MGLGTLLAGAFALLAFAAAPASAAPPATSQIVVYRDVSNPAAETRGRERDLGFSATQSYRRAVEGFAARLTPGQIESLRHDPDVAAVVPDRPVHADSIPFVAGGTLPVGISRVWAERGGSVREAAGPAVAVIDTGIDLSNPDLNVTAGKNCVGNGAPQDDNGHGTHVAGTIAALNNGSRVVGVAPGTHLYAVKVLNARGSGSISSIICGIDWVTQNAAALGIKVVNMSLGSDGSVGSCASDPEHAAICSLTGAGVTVVAAAGNDGEPLTTGASGHVPGAYPEVLTVTAMADTDGNPGGAGGICRGDADDTPASFSNYGSAAQSGHIIAAPGDCVVSLAIGPGTATMSGTSMATPHVVGAAALCIAEGATPGPCSGLPPAGVIATLRTIAEEGATATNGFQGDPGHPLGRYYGYLLRAALPPLATTLGAAAADHQATLHGSLDTDGEDASWWFEYGETTSYGQSTAPQPIAPGSDPEPVQADATGLDAGSPYHYRLVVQAGDWTVRGDDQTVTTTGTPPPPPPDTTIVQAPPARTTADDVEIGFAAAPADGATFECKLDGGTWSACESPYEATSLAEGGHALSVRATNDAGKTDKTPALATWVVDRTPPNTLIGGAPADQTSSTSAAFGISASESAATFECRLDGGLWTACTSPLAITGLAPGAHVFEVRATDSVGLVDPSPAVYSWSISAPAVDPVPEEPHADATPTVPAAPFVAPAPGKALVPLSRLTVVGQARLDRRHRAVSVVLRCRGARACAARVVISLRGRTIASGRVTLAAGAKRRIRMSLVRGIKVALHGNRRYTVSTFS